MEALIRVSLPAIEYSSFPWYEFFFNVFDYRISNSILFTLPPMGRPRYVNESFPTLHNKSFVADCNQPSSVRLPMIELLWKLTWRPEANNWKRMRAFFMLRRKSIFGGQKIIVSSAYWRCVSFMPSLDISTLYHKPQEVAFWINRLRNSTIRSKRKGIMGPLGGGLDEVWMV